MSVSLAAAFRSIQSRLISLRWTLSENAADSAALDKILAKTATDGDCLIWQGATSTQGGYGYLGGCKYAHREAYRAYYGDLEPGSLYHESGSVEIHHTCGNRLCVNPLHLEAITRNAHSRRHKGSRRRLKDITPATEVIQ